MGPVYVCVICRWDGVPLDDCLVRPSRSGWCICLRCYARAVGAPATRLSPRYETEIRAAAAA